MATRLKTSRGPAPESASTAETGFAKITRIWASVSAFPIGETDAIQDGSDGLGNAATGPSLGARSAGFAHDETATAAMAAPKRARERIVVEYSQRR